MLPTPAAWQLLLKMAASGAAQRDGRKWTEGFHHDTAACPAMCWIRRTFCAIRKGQLVQFLSISCKYPEQLWAFTMTAPHVWPLPTRRAEALLGSSLKPDYLPHRLMQQ
jgi:hypothetical protein